MDLTYILRWQPNETVIDDLHEFTYHHDVISAPLSTVPHLAIPYLIAITIAIICGCFGNCLVIACVAVDKELHNVGNLFIVNLAFADLCVSTFIDAFSAAGIIIGEQWFVDRPGLCDAIGSVCLTSCFCSLLNIGAISFNRFIHICHSQHYSKIFTRRNTILMCIGLWIISFLGQMSNFLGWGDFVYDKKVLTCVYDRMADLSYTIFFVSFGIGFPVILIIICYVKIFLFVRRSKKRIEQMRNKNDAEGISGKEKQNSVKLARTLFTIFVVFALCWLPYAFVAATDIHDTYPTSLHSFVVALAHTSSSINSIIYGVTNKQFRRAYMKILRIDRCLNKKGDRMGDSTMDEGTLPTVA